uniref:eIF3h C-terminal domain-containing protein n=1 Tax=Vombatus ursinus TaxID=29139 RepID=A0A4X2K9V3_VOMUR
KKSKNKNNKTTKTTKAKIKLPQPPARMDSLLIAGQMNTYCQNIKESAAQNLGKLFMSQTSQEYN